MKKYNPMIYKIFMLLMSGMMALVMSCTLAPDYTRPQSPVSDGWPSGAAYQETKPADAAPAALALRWRDFFVDEKLQMVIAEALDNNRDLRLAALNVQRARALYGIQRAELLPSLDVVGSGSKQRIPAELSTTGRAMTTEQYSVNLGISAWEIDFFGRIRSLKDLALEQYLATEEAHRSAQIVLVSAVANAYLTFAADRERLKLTVATFETQEESYRMVGRLFEVGLASELDRNQAKTQVDSARRDVARLTQLVAQDKNALNLLVGASAPLSTESLPEDLEGVKPFREISPGISSEVLLDRPDILAGEHRLKAVNANIGAARAAFFPRISLTATVGTASSELSGLFQSDSGTWNFAPRIVWPIFDARMWSAYNVTKVDREIALAEYEKAIQTAFREVADALALRGTVDQQLSAQQSLRDAISEAYRLNETRYQKGIDSYLGVLIAQRSLYAADQGLVDFRLAKLANQVRLFAVLGGGSE